MQHFSTIGEIKSRAEGLGLTMTRLGQLAGMAPSTAVGRVGGRERDSRVSTLRKLSEALFSEELRMRDYLLALHPLAGPAVASHSAPAATTEAADAQ